MFGAGSIPASWRISHTVEEATFTPQDPQFAINPPLSPAGFSQTIRGTRARMNRTVGGRPLAIREPGHSGGPVRPSTSPAPGMIVLAVDVLGAADGQVAVQRGGRERQEHEPFDAAALDGQVQGGVPSDEENRACGRVDTGWHSGYRADTTASGLVALLLEAEFFPADFGLDGLLAFQPVGPFGLQVLDLGRCEGARDTGTGQT